MFLDLLLSTRHSLGVEELMLSENQKIHVLLAKFMDNRHYREAAFYTH